LEELEKNPNRKFKLITTTTTTSTTSTTTTSTTTSSTTSTIMTNDLSENNKHVSTPTDKEEVIPALLDLETNQIITLEENKDLTSLIGIHKYESPLCVGNPLKWIDRIAFPSFFHKTDQTRIQNVPHYITTYGEVEFEVTEKLEGSSLSVFFFNGSFGVCSRNFQLQLHNDTGVVKYIKEIKIKEKLENFGKDIALQGELIGPSIQLNIYRLKKHEWKIFDVYLIKEARYATPDERETILKELQLDDSMVPVLEPKKKIGNMSVADILRYAEGFSVMLKEKKSAKRRSSI